MSLDTPQGPWSLFLAADHWQCVGFTWKCDESKAKQSKATLAAGLQAPQAYPVPARALFDISLSPQLEALTPRPMHSNFKVKLAGGLKAACMDPGWEATKVAPSTATGSRLGAKVIGLAGVGKAADYTKSSPHAVTPGFEHSGTPPEVQVRVGRVRLRVGVEARAPPEQDLGSPGPFSSLSPPRLGAVATVASTSRRPVQSEVLARLAGRLCIDHVERTCPECRVARRVPEPRLQVVAGVVPEDPTPATLDMLSRHPKDPAGPACGVEVLESLVGMVSSLGSQNLPRTLGHPSILRFVEQHTRRFVCPACDPRGFGLSRACAASVMCLGTLNFEGARELLVRTLDLVRLQLEAQRRGRASGGASDGCDEAVERLDMGLQSAELGVSAIWFARWIKCY